MVLLVIDASVKSAFEMGLKVIIPDATTDIERLNSVFHRLLGSERRYKVYP